MPTKPLDRAIYEKYIAATEEALAQGYRPPGIGGNGPAAKVVAADSLKINRTTFSNALDRAKHLHDIESDWSLWHNPHKAETIPPAPIPEAPDAAEDISEALRKNPYTLDELANWAKVSRGQALDIIDNMRASGVNVHQFGERWSIEKHSVPAFAEGEGEEYLSRPDNTFLCGVASDSHLGSKYERMDCLNDLYDRFEAAGVDRVFHCGNWIEGESRFNKHELLIHGMTQQLDYLAKHYPSRPGIKTYAVAGDDHEGWYAQREGVDIGKYAENIMRDYGRDDWVNLGYMEAHVPLVNANTGKQATLAVVHPGGGASYADSYVVQKILESLEGGEKPAVAFYGHYHKQLAGEYRNVWWLLAASTKDQDMFMRKKRLRSVVGGAIVLMKQDPETGAIFSFTPELIRYFNKDYYSGRWSHSGPVVLPERIAGP